MLEFLIVGCCGLSMVAFVWEEWRSNYGRGTAVYNAIETFVTVVLCFEFLLRVLATRKPLRLLRSMSTYIDILCFLPWIVERLYFATASSPDYRAIQDIRILRILRPFKLGRHSEWMRVRSAAAARCGSRSAHCSSSNNCYNCSGVDDVTWM